MTNRNPNTGGIAATPGIINIGARQLPTKPLNNTTAAMEPWGTAVEQIGQQVANGGPNGARAQMLKRAVPRGTTFGGYTPDQLAADPSLVQKLGANGAQKYKEYQAAQQAQPQVKPAVAPQTSVPPRPAVVPMGGGGQTPPYVNPDVIHAQAPGPEPMQMPQIDPRQYAEAVAADRAMVSSQMNGTAAPQPVQEKPMTVQPQMKPMVLPTAEGAQAGPTADQLRRMFPGLFAV